MSNLFTTFMESYERNSKRDFKRKELEYELRNEEPKKGVLRDPFKSNTVMVNIDGKDWKTMSLPAAKKAATKLTKQGKKVTARYIKENQEFNIDELLENDELTEELLDFMEQVEPGDPDPEELDDAEEAGPKGKKLKEEEEQEEEGDPDPEELDDAEEAGPKGKKIKEALSKDVKDAIAGTSDSEADELDDEDVLDTEPDESKKAAELDLDEEDQRKKRVLEALSIGHPIDNNRADCDEPIFIDPTIRGEDDQAIGAEISRDAGRI